MTHIKYFLLFLALFMNGCATTSDIEILDKDSLQVQFSIDQIKVKNDTGETFDIDIETMLTDALKKELEIQGLTGNDGLPYALSVSIVQYSKGSAFGRWLMPGVGKTILSVEANITDSEGVILAESQATRSIGAGGGFTIGAWQKVFTDVAESLIQDLVAVS